MTVDPWMTLTGIFITAVLSYAAARYAGKSSVKVKELDVDGQAYIRAEGITQGLIETLRKQIEDLQQDRASDLARIKRLSWRSAKYATTTTPSSATATGL